MTRPQAASVEPGAGEAPPRYIQRMCIYFREMLPLGPHALLAAAMYLAVAGFVALGSGVAFSPWTVSTLVGIGSVFALFLVVRLMDELKDVEVDRRLFPHRPVPSGRVKLCDIRGTLAAVMLVYIAINGLLPAATWTAAAALGYALLMFRFFFMPRLIRRSLPLALVTHNPLVPIMLFHCVSVAAAGHGLALGSLNWDLVPPFLVLAWAPLLAWEVSRKIRAPQEETAYVTYSRIFGVRGAVALSLFVQSTAAAIGFFLFIRLDLSSAYVAILAVALSISMASHVRLLTGTKRSSSRLRPATEIFGVGVYLAQIFAFIWPSTS